jgi:hypothetical protein
MRTGWGSEKAKPMATEKVKGWEGVKKRQH